jgi:Trk K+ transport system NAD-binding subunit
VNVVQSPVIVVGLDPVGLAVAHRLHALQVPVRALATASERQRYGTELAALGIDVEPASEAWENDLQRLDLGNCGAVVLAADDDAQNVDACLLVRRYHGDVPLAVRVSDPTLVRFLRMTVPHVDVYSMGSTTAPVAAELAIQLLGQGRPDHDRPTQRRRDNVGLPRTTAALLWIIATCVAFLVPATFVFSLSMRVARLDAFQLAFSQLMSVGNDARLLHSSAGVRVLAMLLALLGRVFLACGVGLVLDWVLTRRLAAVAQSTGVRMSGHVVICGAGNVGAKVAELLHKRKVKVAVVESNASLRNVQRLRSKGIPVILGDATVDETLELAGAFRAGAALALTNSDAVNLHIGLQLTDKRVGVPTAVRLLAPELSAHVVQSPHMSTVSPVAETAIHVCRTVERMRLERIKAQLEPLPPEIQRTTGRFAGPEFEPAAAPSTTVPPLEPTSDRGDGPDKQERHEPAA